MGLGRFPSENGVVAPGMSCVYNIRFSPDSLADYDDVIKVGCRPVQPPLLSPEEEPQWRTLGFL